MPRPKSLPFAPARPATIAALALAACFACARPALAVQLYFAGGSVPQGLDRVNLQPLPQGTLIIAPDDREPLPSQLGLARIATPSDGRYVHLVANHRGHPELDVLALHGEILLQLDDFAVLAVTPQQDRTLDRMHVCRQLLQYVPPARTSHPGLFPRPFEPLPGKADDATKTAIVNGFSEATFSQYIQELSGWTSYWIDGSQVTNNNRYTHNANHHKAADYLEDRFESFGYPVIRQNFMVGSTPTQNIIAVKTGTTTPEEIIVVGAHYDATSEIAQTLAPGAEDNASGTAAVLHLAEIFAPFQTEKTVHFAAFSGEENGILGSLHYVNEAVANADLISNAVVLDMISAWSSNYKVIIEGDEPWETLMSLFEGNILAWSSIGYRKDYFSFGSDHVRFQNAGIPAFLAIDWDYPSYAHYHKSTDTFDKVDTSLGYEIGRAVAATLSDLAQSSATTTPPVVPAVSLRLHQNTPNPFNPQTIISFEILQANHVRLDIFDVRGRHVARLIDEFRQGPRGQAVWEGRDESGQPVPSGVYIYRLQVADQVLSRRMVLAK